MEQKNILIISPFFFDYHNRIKRALEDRGACVDVVDEQPSHNAFARIMMRIFPCITILSAVISGIFFRL